MRTKEIMLAEYSRLTDHLISNSHRLAQAFDERSDIREALIELRRELKEFNDKEVT